MSQLSEIIIEPGKSAIYLRLTRIVYLITLILIFYSSIYLLIKGILFIYILNLLRIDSLKQRPCASIQRIHFTGREWALEMSRGKKESYSQLSILAHNSFFLLIEFKDADKAKQVVLFVDQISTHQLRLLNLQKHINGI